MFFAFRTMLLAFQSTPSARRATQASLRDFMREAISIHALREEGDRRGCGGLPLLCIFQSTPSARRATCSFSQRVVV